jgi:hypothetical protein
MNPSALTVTEAAAARAALGKPLANFKDASGCARCRPPSGR